MKFNQATLQATLRQRDLILWVSLILAMVNIILVFRLVLSEERWVLIPQYDTDHRVAVTSSRYSEDYFIDWASGIVGILLCVNPDSVDWKNQQILKISTERYGDLKERLKKEALRVKQDQVSTVFYPKRFKVDQDKQSLDITGQHLSYFGKGSEPVSLEKTFRLSWVVRAQGIILLKDFVEIKKDA